MLESVRNAASDVVSVVELRGRLDSTTSRDFEGFFDEMTRTGKRAFVLGVRDLEYVSSAGMAVLVRFLRRVEERQGVIVLVNPHSELRLLLQFFQLDKRLVVKETMEEAKAHALAVLPGESALEIRRGEDIRSTPLDPAAARSGAPHTSTAGTNPGKERPLPPGDITRLGENTTWPRPIFDDAPAAMSAGKNAAVGAGTTPGQNAPSSAAWAKTPQESGRDRMQASGLVEVEAHPSSVSSGPALPNVERFVSMDQPFHEPVVLECEQCRAQVRVYRPGQHMCPSCRIVFRVRRDGTASFQEKFKP